MNEHIYLMKINGLRWDANDSNEDTCYTAFLNAHI